MSNSSLVDVMVVKNQFNVVVPSNYDHTKHLDSVRERNKASVKFFQNEISDENWKKATNRLSPGQKFQVKVFQPATAIYTNLDQLNSFIFSIDAVYTGAHGLSLVLEQQKRQMERHVHYYSVDRREALYRKPDNNSVIGAPYITDCSNYPENLVSGNYHFSVDYTMNLGPIAPTYWHQKMALLAFFKQ